MRKVTVTRYEAFDGELFETERACREYERRKTSKNERDGGDKDVGAKEGQVKAKRRNWKNRSLDTWGRTPEQVLKEFKHRYIIPYSVNVDIDMCKINGDIKGIRLIKKLLEDGDEMELLRRRDSVNWAARMLRVKKGHPVR